MTTVNTQFRIVGDNKSGQAFASIGKSVGGLRKQASGANQGIGGLGKALGGVGKILPALGFAASTAALATFAKGAVDAADELGKISTRTGVTVETLSSLEVAARQGGTSLGTLERGLSGLSRRAVEAANGSKTAGEGFMALGVEVKDSNGNVKDADQLYAEVADKIADMEDGTRKNAIAQQIFGKSGADLIPVLNGGSEAMADNITTSEEFARQSEEINDRLDDLGVITKQVGNLFLSVLLPPTLKLVTGTVNLAKAIGQRLKPVWDVLVPIIDTAGKIFFEIAETVGKNLLGVLGNLAKFVGDLIGPFFDTGEESKKAGEEVDKFAEAGKAVQRALGTLGKFLVDTNVFVSKLGIQFGASGRRAIAFGNAIRNIGKGGLDGLGDELERIDRDTQEAIRGVEARGRGAKEAIDRATGAVKPFGEGLKKAGDEIGKDGGGDTEDDSTIKGKLVGATKQAGDLTSELESAVQVLNKYNKENKAVSVFGDKASRDAAKRAVEKDIAEVETERFNRATATIRRTEEVRKGAFRAQLDRLNAYRDKEYEAEKQRRADQEHTDFEAFNRRVRLLESEAEIQKRIDENYTQGIRDRAALRKGFIDDLRGDIQGAVKGFITGTKSFGDALRDIGSGVLARLTDQISGNIADALVGAVGKGENAFAGLANGLPGLFQGFFNFLGNGFKSVVNLASGLFGGIFKGLGGLFGGGGGGGLGGILGGLGRGITGVVGGIGKAISGIFGGGGGIFGGGGAALVGTPVAQTSSTVAAAGAGGGASALLAASPILGILGLGLATSRPGGTVLDPHLFQEMLKDKLKAGEELTQAEVNYAGHLIREQQRRERSALISEGASHRRARDTVRPISHEILLDRALERIGFTDEEAERFTQAVGDRYRRTGFNPSEHFLSRRYGSGGLEEARRLLREESERILAQQRGTTTPTTTAAAAVGTLGQEYGNYLYQLREQIRSNPVTVDPNLEFSRRFYSEAFPQQTEVIKGLTEKYDQQLAEQKKQNELLEALNVALRGFEPTVNVTAQIDGEDLENTIVSTVIKEQQEDGALYPGAGRG